VELIESFNQRATSPFLFLVFAFPLVFLGSCFDLGNLFKGFWIPFYFVFVVFRLVYSLR
jgi:hypothetical protein